MAETLSPFEAYKPAEIAGTLLDSLVATPDNPREIILATLTSLPSPDLTAATVWSLYSTSWNNERHLPESARTLLDQIQGGIESTDPEIVALVDIFHRSDLEFKYFNLWNKKIRPSIQDGEHRLAKARGEWQAIEPEADETEPDQSVINTAIAVHTALQVDMKTQNSAQKRVIREFPVEPIGNLDPRIAGSIRLGEYIERMKRILGQEGKDRASLLKKLEANIDSLLSVHPNVLAKTFLNYVLTQKERSAVIELRSKIIDAEDTMTTLGGTVDYTDETYRSWAEPFLAASEVDKTNNLYDLDTNSIRIRRLLCPYLDKAAIDENKRIAFSNLMHETGLIIVFGDRIAPPNEIQSPEQ